MANRDIIVIGGSAGSGAVLREVLAGLPGDLPASLFIATHVPSQSPGYLADMLSRSSSLPVSAAIDGAPIERGHVYVAVPDRHLLVIDGTMRLGDGPRENMSRPAIDPLFRSAALAHGSRTVGVILSGLLNDGASGLSAIERCGGAAIVQHPLDAEADQMPLAALEAVENAEVVPRDTLAGSIVNAVKGPAAKPVPPPHGLALEVEIAGGSRLGSEALRKIADPTAITCPECQGVLSEVRGERPLRFRCQIGHAQTAEIIAAHPGHVDEAMRVALRVMEERVTLVARMAQDAWETGRTAVAELYQSRAEEYGRYATILREAAIEALRPHRDAGNDTR